MDPKPREWIGRIMLHLDQSSWNWANGLIQDQVSYLIPQNDQKGTQVHREVRVMLEEAKKKVINEKCELEYR